MCLFERPSTVLDVLREKFVRKLSRGVDRIFTTGLNPHILPSPPKDYEVVVVKHVGILRCLVDCRLFCSCPRRDGCPDESHETLPKCRRTRDVPSKTSAVRPRVQSNVVRSPSINVSQADGLLCRRNLGLDKRSPNDIIQLVVSLMSSCTLATRK